MTLHKQQLVKFGLTAISALILTACGSSGGGSSAPSSANTTPANQIQQPSQPKAEAKPEQPTQPKVESKPEQPAQPKAEAKPEQPTQPKVEAKPEQPAQPKVEVKPEQPAQPKVEEKPEPEQPVQPKVEAKPEQPVQPKVEAKPEQPIQPKVEAKPEQPVQPKVETKPEQPTQPKVEAKPEQPVLDTSTGAFTSVKNKVGNDGFDIHIYPLHQFNVNKISIEGVEIDIDSEDYLNNLWASFSNNEYNRDITICCQKYSDVRFGIANSLDDKDDSAADYLFYNGNPTKSMPMVGKANYQGHTVFHDAGDSDDKLIVGSALFNVDFSEKKLNGVLAAENKKPVNINASIQDNRFNGFATSEDFDAKTEVKVEGKFFGENAKELGGLAESFDDTFGAAFGAEKQ